MASHNSGRSPKDLRHLLNVARQGATFFPEEIEENLAKLKCLSKDETSKNAMLRDRIDQQSELICVLKKQADTSLLKSQSLECDMKELQVAKDEAECSYHDEARKYNVLEKRFQILWHNHEEIIKIKDGYKVVNDELRKENKALLARKAEEIASLVDEKNKRIVDLENELKTLSDEFQKCNNLLTDYKEQSVKNEQYLDAEIIRLKSKLGQTEQRAFELETERDVLVSDLTLAKKDMMNLRKEISHRCEETLEQTDVIQKHQQQISELREKIQELESLLKRQKENFTKEMEDACANVQVRKLKTLLRKAEDKVVNHDKEFNAYKTHTEKLLLKERELNSKLRQIIG